MRRFGMSLKKAIFMLIFANLMLIFANLSYAQTAKIIDIEGQVLVKNDSEPNWQKAKLNMLLGKDAEVETKINSYCTLAFDEELKNVLTIKENSLIKIESVWPGDIFLPRGRVFSLIENLAKQEKFQIRTPTAIAGARGTGWVTSSMNIKTSAICCFIDMVYIQGLDNLGKVTGQKDLSSGFGLDIGESGVFGEIRSLGDENYREWNDFINYIDELRGEIKEGDYNHESLEGLKEEAQDDFRSQVGESRRQEEEAKAGGGQQQ